MRTVFVCLLLISNSLAADTLYNENITIYGRSVDMTNHAISASEGMVGQGDIQQRPMFSTGEILEFVPGMVVTQHSGSGKANQYFLRGFNLDHGTDFRTSIEGMPINQRTHGHGHGYTDLNFIVPEFISRMTYRKGPYHADQGDFSTAGSADFYLMHHFEDPFVLLEVGEDQYLRHVAAGNIELGNGTVALGLEAQQYDGPWDDIDEDVKKLNLMMRYHQPVADGLLSLTLMTYDNQWNSADQIPRRAVDNNTISRLGSLDTTVGGESSRSSLSGQWQNDAWKVNAYVIQSELDLFSNFTYFLEDPVNGDQFQQLDERISYGGNIHRSFKGRIADKMLVQRTGIQIHADDIDNVGLYHTESRNRLSTVREDAVEQYSVGLFWDAELTIMHALAATLGIRYDYLDADVDSDNTANSGGADDGLVSFKSGLIYTINQQWSAYLNAGQSFHSNDVRGAVITQDPVTAAPVDQVDLLVRGEGGELGVRFYDSETLHLSLGLWLLELDSELLFVGDAGTTEANRPSRRYGAELTAYYWFSDQFSADIELAWTRSRFTEDEPGEGNHIEGALPFVASLGLSWKPTEKWRSSLRLRHFGKRTLDSFNDEQSERFSVVNADIAYQIEDWTFSFEALNLFDSKDHLIDYFYTSRLQGEPLAGVEDNHFHPIEPRTFRLGAIYRF